MTRPALTIGELAARSGCNVPTIRYYEEIGLLAPAARRPGGHRAFADGDLRRLMLIRRCREFGFSIGRVRQLVELAEDPGRDCFEARDMAEAHLAEVRTKLSALRILERNLARFVESCAKACKGGPGPDCAVLEDLGGAPRPRDVVGRGQARRAGRRR